MGGVVSDVTRGLTDVATFGTAEIVNAATGNKLFGSALTGPGGYLQKFTQGGGNGSGPANPPGIGPTMGGADASGIPLLAQVALGTPVDDALGALYGVAPGTPFSQWSQSVSPDDMKQILPLRASLQNVQSDQKSTQAVITNLTQNYPQVMAQQLQSVSQSLGPAYNQAAASAMNLAAGQLSAQFAAQGGFSSGAFNQSLGQAIAVPEMQYLTGQAQNSYDQQLQEAQAQRQYQQSMLGQQVNNVFSANQAALGRITQFGLQNNQNQAQQSQQNNQNLFGLGSSVGQTAGLLGIGAMTGGGPAMAAGMAGGGDGVVGGPGLNMPSPGYMNPYGY